VKELSGKISVQNYYKLIYNTLFKLFILYENSFTMKYTLSGYQQGKKFNVFKIIYIIIF
jgi:hypothetical protein